MSAVIWPAGRFFWAVLDAPGVKAGAMPAGLAAALQEEVPVDVDLLHAAVRPFDSARVLVCAARGADLDQLGAECLSLRAESVPDFVGIPNNIHAPEMLVGSREPLPLRRERGRRWAIASAAVVIVAGVLSVGLVRRAGVLDDFSEKARTRSAAALTAATPEGTSESLAREVARLRPLGEAKRPLTPPDGAAAIAGLLRAWPAGVECEANAVSVSAASMVLTLSVSGDARPLLEALKAPEGWVLDEPRLSSVGEKTRVTLSLKRRAGSGA